MHTAPSPTWITVRNTGGVSMERLGVNQAPGDGQWRLRTATGEIISVRDEAEAIARYSLELRNAIVLARTLSDAA